jgi:hypothetical protein
MRIGEILIQQKLLTREALAEALEAQVLQGGRLGTNLVELGLVQERDLAKALGQQHGVAYAAGEMIPDPKALEVLDLNYADTMDLLPMRMETTRISIATLNPRDIKTLDAIAFKTGKRVVPVVIPEFRMNQMLRKYCKAFRPLRPIDLGQIGKAQQAAEKAGKGASSGPDLMSEDEFQSMYAHALSGESAVAATPAKVASSPAPQPSIPAATQVPEAPPPITATPSQAAGRPPPPAAPAAEPLAPPPPVVTPPPEPLTFAAAQAALAKSDDREDVARNVLRFALSKWKRTLLLAVQGDLVTGWRGFGEGVNEQGVQRIAISLRTPTPVKLVRDTRSHFIGTIKQDASMDTFYKLLGGGYPTTAVMLPLLVRGNVVHILYVDNGPKKLTAPDVGELLILSQSVGRSYEAMIQRRKAG